MEPKVGQVWKDIWLNTDGSVRYIDIFHIVEINVENPNGRMRKYNPDNKGFIKEYLVANSGCKVGQKEWKYDTALKSFKYRTTVQLRGYNSPLWKAINGHETLNKKG